MADTFTITCYRKTKTYPENQRNKMIKEYQTAMICCDGSEADCYRNIYGDLIDCWRKRVHGHRTSADSCA